MIGIGIRNPHIFGQFQLLSASFERGSVEIDRERPMYFGRLAVLLTVTPSAAQRSVLLKAIRKSAPRRGEGFASSAAAGTMDKPESDVVSAPDPAAVSDATVPGSEAGNNGETRAEWPWKRAKKVAVMISFAGKNYFGMQR